MQMSIGKKIEKNSGTWLTDATDRPWPDFCFASDVGKLTKTNLPRHGLLKKVLADPVCCRELQNFFRSILLILRKNAIGGCNGVNVSVY